MGPGCRVTPSPSVHWKGHFGATFHELKISPKIPLRQGFAPCPAWGAYDTDPSNEFWEERGTARKRDDGDGREERGAKGNGNDWEMGERVKHGKAREGRERRGRKEPSSA